MAFIDIIIVRIWARFFKEFLLNSGICTIVRFCWLLFLQLQGSSLYPRITLMLRRRWILYFVQCGRSSLSQRWGADLRPQCSVKVQKTLKTLIKRSQELPEMFEIVLRPLWWAAGNEQPSPPLHRAAAARLLRCFDKYNSLYSRNMIANRFVVQCGRSSLSQRWGADLRPQCSVKVQKTLKTLS